MIYKIKNKKIYKKYIKFIKNKKIEKLLKHIEKFKHL